MSHGQSQSFNAAMPLPKAMEYETIFKWRKALKDENPWQQTSTDKNLISDVCFRIYKHAMFAPKKKLKNLGALPSVRSVLVFTSYHTPHMNNQVETITKTSGTCDKR